MTLGAHLRNVRKRRGLTQRELAESSGVSLSLISKLEQDQIRDARLETLHLLAKALRVPTSALSGQPDADRPHVDVATAFAPVHRALAGQLPPASDDQPPTAAGVAAALDSLLPHLKTSRYSAVLPTLPALIRDAATLGMPGRAIHSRVLNLAGRMLVITHQYDLAELTLNQALDLAPDRLDASAVLHNLTWLHTRRGDLAQCLTMSTRWADDLEPRLSRATPHEIAAWGWMLLRIALASVRDNRPGDARDALRLAKAAAVAVGREYEPAGDLLRPFGPHMVTAKAAELAAIERRPDRVLALAATIPLTAVQPRSDNWNRHRLDVAWAHVHTGGTAEAQALLLQVRHDAPEWLAEQRYARDVVRAMVERRRTLTDDMRELADAVRLEY